MNQIELEIILQMLVIKEGNNPDQELRENSWE